MSNHGKHRQAGWDSTVSRSDYLGPFVSLSGAFHPLLEMGVFLIQWFLEKSKERQYNKKGRGKGRFTVVSMRVYSCIIIY